MFQKNWQRSKPQMFSDPEDGIVEIEIAPNRMGRVHWRTSQYPAKLYKSNITILPGAAIKVLGSEGFTLLIQPLESEI